MSWETREKNTAEASMSHLAPGDFQKSWGTHPTLRLKGAAGGNLLRLSKPREISADIGWPMLLQIIPTATLTKALLPPLYR